jgi:hypothetical protein
LRAFFYFRKRKIYVSIERKFSLHNDKQFCILMV